MSPSDDPGALKSCAPLRWTTCARTSGLPPVDDAEARDRWHERLGLPLGVRPLTLGKANIAEMEHDLLNRLRNENTPWPSGDPLYMGLREEAADKIESLEEVIRLYRLLQHHSADRQSKHE